MNIQLNNWASIPLLLLLALNLVAQLVNLVILLVVFTRDSPPII